MFRGKGNTELTPNHFSVGSIIDIGNGDETALIVGAGNEIALLDLSNFILLPLWIKVEDINFLTTDDVRLLIKDFQVTFSDNDYNPIGLKELKYKNGVIK